MNFPISLKGFVQVDVLDHRGRIVHRSKKRPNLILDQGLDRLAEVAICDMFLYAVKGTDTVAMSETVTGTYTLDDVGATVTRISGVRDFTSDDEGFLIRSQTGIECIITTISSATVADVRPVGSATLTAYSAKTIKLYRVNATGLASEAGRTGNYSSIVGENTTTTASGNIRTFKRTFLFDPEPSNIETPDVSNTYTWTGTGVTRTAGARDFATGDIGKYIKFPSTGEFCKISSRTSATVVVVDRAPIATHTSLNITLYGYNSYSHIGLSDLAATGANLNVMVRLEDGSGNPSPVLALGENPEVGGQQVKVTYSLVVTFSPVATQSGTGLFSGDTAAMGGASRAGSWVLEAIASSFVASDGSTDISNIGLEPYAGGDMALSISSAALVPLTGSSVPPDRSAGAQFVGMTPNGYVAGSFTNTYSGTFGVTDAVGTNWRTMGIYDEDSKQFLWTYLFTNAQKKPATHSFTLTFRKTWNRDLS
jgi:hypothetical protein